MNFKKAGIFRRNSEGSEQPEVQNEAVCWRFGAVPAVERR